MSMFASEKEDCSNRSRPKQILKNWTPPKVSWSKASFLGLTGMVHLIVRMLIRYYNDSYGNHDPIGLKETEA